MSIRAIQTDAAPAAIGPYSQAVVASAGELFFLSGQIPLDPATGELVTGDAATQAERVLLNLEAVLQAAGLTWFEVAKTTIFLTNMADFGAVNAVYSRHVGEHRPARATVQVAGLPRGVAVEIEAIAVRSPR